MVFIYLEVLWHQNRPGGIVIMNLEVLWRQNSLFGMVFMTAIDREIFLASNLSQSGFLFGISLASKSSWRIGYCEFGRSVIPLNLLPTK